VNGAPARSDASSRRLDRRTVLGTVAAAGAASLAGCSAGDGEDGNGDGSGDGNANATATEVADGAARDLAERFAPTLYFDAAERWFPTDPRAYETERDGEPVVNGFDAFDGYTARARESDAPPDPTVFYHAVRYEASPLAVVQFWCYSAFDQFATNFHWHDWEVLHVFVDTDVGEPVLYVASSHSRKVPNNEFLDPDPGVPPRVLSELGSHSSALSVNDRPERFQRLSTGDTAADITNRAVEALGDLAAVPAAYGLPRDEGARLPYLVPELDGAPVYEHERLPSVERSDLIDGPLTVRSFDALASPPTDLPARSTGLAFGPESRTDDADVTYDLVPTADLEHLGAFTGPQLSFEFAVPAFAEDAVASHITSVPAPWTQPRYADPVADVSDPTHRAALADRYDAVAAPTPTASVLAAVGEAVTADEAPDGKGLTTTSLGTEALALLESEAEAVPTFRGVAMVRGVEAGDHRLTVNGAGVAPHAEPVSVAPGESAVAGVEGEVPLVAREDATKLEVDAAGTDAELTDLAVEDDFAGRLYDAPLSGPDAVYVHRGGAYTTEVRDAADEVGAFRVVPEDGATVRIEEPRTGKAPLATFLADLAEETSAEVAAVGGDGDDSDGSGNGQGGSDGNSTSDGGGGGSTDPGPVRGLSRALAAVAAAARRAAERAEAGDRAGADERLEAVATRLDRVATRLEEARSDLPGGLSRATDRRLEQARRRAEQARNAGKL
jgi:hypothetical protein